MPDDDGGLAMRLMRASRSCFACCLKCGIRHALLCQSCTVMPTYRADVSSLPFAIGIMSALCSCLMSDQTKASLFVSVAVPLVVSVIVTRSLTPIHIPIAE